MKPLHVRARGFTCLDVDLDLRGLPPGLVAIVGGNGAGKSSLLDLLAPVPVYRMLASKPGEVMAYCTGPAEIDVLIEHDGSTYRHLLQVDPTKNGGRGQTKAWLTRDGVPLGDGGTDGGTTSYDQACAAHYPDSTMFLASAFSAQGRGGNFFSLTVPQRKDLFATLLGLGELQRTAEKATENRKRLDAELAELDARNAVLLEHIAQAEAKRADLSDAEAALPALQAEHDAASRTLVGASTAAAQAASILDGLVQTRDAALRRQADLVDERAKAEVAWDRAGAEWNACIVLTSKANEIRENAATLATLLAQHREVTQALAVLQQQVAAAAAAMVPANNDLLDLRRRRSAAGNTASLQGAPAELARVEQATANLPRLREELADLAGYSSRMAAATAERERLMLEAREAKHRAQAYHADLVSARSRAGLISGVPCGGNRALVFASEREEGVGVNCGDCRFLGDARAAVTAIPELERELDAANKAATDYEEQAQTARKVEADIAVHVQRHDAIAKQVRDLAIEEARLDGLRAKVATIAQMQRDYATLSADVDTAEYRLADLERAHAALDAERWATAATLASITIGDDIADADKRLKALEAAEARYAGVVEAREAAEERHHRATEALMALHIPPDPEAATANANSTAITEQVARAEEATVRRRLTQQREYVARLQGALDTLGGVEDQTTALAARRERLASERSGWVLIEQAFGRDGLQALEIDAAGPEVSSITNELLLAVFGPRFTLSLRTVTEAKGGRVQREVFDVLVLDGESGGTRTYAALSGGQQVLIDVALRLALCVFNARRHGSVFPVLFLDEVDGALSDELAARYPSMLRRALDLGGFTTAIFVSHRPAVSAQADATITMDGGRATMEAT